MEKDSGVWDEIYRNARKAEKLKSEGHERDEGELERTGQALCIYEIYDGAGAWPFLHHGSLYRGLSLVSFPGLAFYLFPWLSMMFVILFFGAIAVQFEATSAMLEIMFFHCLHSIFMLTVG